MCRLVRFVIAGVLSIAVSFTVATENDLQAVMEVNQLDLVTALQVAQASISQCRKDGLSVSVSVVDSHGTAQVMLRDTTAKPISLRLSRMKAYTSVNFSADTETLADKADTAVGRSDGVLMAAGGVLIKLETGEILGAVGVSGSNSGAADSRCAKAGADAIKPVLDKTAESEAS